jgi:hypothetical protein
MVDTDRGVSPPSVGLSYRGQVWKKGRTMAGESGVDPSACEGEAGQVDGQEELLPAYFLDRLTRLLELERKWRSGIDGPPPRLLAHALYSTYTDCVQLGRRAEAQRMLGVLVRDA